MIKRRSTRPVVGIPTQTLQSLGGVSAEIPPSWVMSQRYVATLTGAGAVPWLIPLIDDATLRDVFDHLDAVFLPGGADIDPVSYGREPHPLCDKTDRERDRVELALATWAIDEGKPVLGVCRGMQILNLAAGGTLYQDLAEQRSGSIKHDYFPFVDPSFRRDYLAHEVHVSPGTRLARIFGEGILRVNSMHHQGVRDIGRDLTVSATATDGLIEGFEGDRRSAYVVGVQWHPEALTDHHDPSKRLFEDFVNAAV